ncbi:MAG: FAD-dependent oxidoreductase [Candidatus Brocadiaceae bacterium]|nr:FAD-dependent oxidoreductase [Candidatus Brocadiaceae bacterium]
MGDRDDSGHPVPLREVCATCRAACPVHTDTQAYVQLITQGRYEEAFEKIREFNPFPSVCSLICHHPCEQACRRGDVDDPVALRHLKRFAVEQARPYRERRRRRAPITQPQTVGVIGAGPAGLTAAHDCVAAGYAATVYDAHDRPGGLLAHAVPAYRLPPDVLELDLDDIRALGVQVVCGTAVGRDVSLDEVRARHDAVVLAVGLSRSRTLPLTNGDHPDVLGALEFLQAVAAGARPAVPADVLVVGGGNVAVDAARTALRLGAQAVRMVCLEDESEMPAWDWECREALEEGIGIVHRRGPTEVVVRGGAVAGLVVREVERVFDDDGRFAPTYFDDRRSTIDGQMVILAVGQQADLGLLDGTEVERQGAGRIRFDRATMAASVPGVFACGEVVAGPGSAIEAVADGHRAARAVLRYLRTGRVEPVAEEEAGEEVGPLTEDLIRHLRRAERVAMPTLSAEARRRSFARLELGYSERDALREAWRCLSCTAGAQVDEAKCAACLTCLRVCPFGVPMVDDVALMTSDICQACGLCVAECPAGAIRIGRHAVGDIAGRIAELLKRADRPVTCVEIACARGAESRVALQDHVHARNGDEVGHIAVACAALADEVDMMKPFEFGVREVVVRMCDDCRYRGAGDRLSKRVERTKRLLDAAGVGGERLRLL